MEQTATPPSLRWAAASDVGRVRRVNEDGVLAEAPLFAVADGMGGHAAGEVASSLALATLRETLGAKSQPSLEAIVAGVQAANLAVFNKAAEQAHLRGMGTTLCGLFLAGQDDRLVIVNVGDSRAYVLQDGTLVQISRDHSYVEELVAAGELTREEARSHPHRNIVTRALGIEPRVEVDAWQVALTPGDRYLLCSDGLFGEVDEAVITQVLTGVADPQAAADQLVRLANEHGGRDNISVVVVDVLAPGPALDPGVEAAAAAPGTPSTTVAPPPAGESGSTRKRPRLRVSSVLFVVAVLAVVGVAVGAIQHYGSDGYYVAFGPSGKIEVYKGRQGGLLWVEPSRAGVFVLGRDDLTTAWQARIADGITFTTREAVDRWYQALSRNPGALAATATATTTTTTTTPPTTAVTTAATTTTTAGP